MVGVALSPIKRKGLVNKILSVKEKQLNKQLSNSCHRSGEINV